MKRWGGLTVRKKKRRRVSRIRGEIRLLDGAKGVAMRGARGSVTVDDRDRQTSPGESGWSGMATLGTTKSQRSDTEGWQGRETKGCTFGSGKGEMPF